MKYDVFLFDWNLKYYQLMIVDCVKWKIYMEIFVSNTLIRNLMRTLKGG